MRNTAAVLHSTKEHKPTQPQAKVVVILNSDCKDKRGTKIEVMQLPLHFFLHSLCLQRANANWPLPPQAHLYSAMATKVSRQLKRGD